MQSQVYQHLNVVNACIEDQIPVWVISHDPQSFKNNVVLEDAKRLSWVDGSDADMGEAISKAAIAVKVIFPGFAILFSSYTIRWS